MRLLIAFVHHRWALPIIVELQRAQGSKFVTLANRLGAGRDSVRQALDALIEMELVVRNPGYGHPLRPEYILTTAGVELAPAATRLLEALRNAGLEDIGLRKWTLPAVFALAEGGARFTELRAVLPGITGRSLGLALRELQAAGLAAREVLPTYPPTTAYTLTGRGRELAGLVGAVAAAGQRSGVSGQGIGWVPVGSPGGWGPRWPYRGAPEQVWVQSRAV